jgi:hypothetical protein
MATKITLKKVLKIFHCPYWLAGLLAVLFILRIPSFYEPFSYGDEMIYLTLGNGIHHGLTLYKDIHDNKPPLLYFTAAVAGSVFWFRIILAFWMMVTTVIFWYLVEHLFPKNNNIVKISTIVFGLLTTLPLLEGQIANAELFMLAPTLLAFYLALQKKLNYKKVALIGVLMALAALFKIPAAFDLGAIVFYWFYLSLTKKLSFKKFILYFLTVSLAFFAVIGLTVLYYAAKGAFNEYIVAAFLQNFGYLSSWKRASQDIPFLVKNGPLLIRGVVVLIGLGLLLAYKKHLSKSFIVSVAWLLFSLFAVTLSERPYPHYLIQIVPAVSILFGILIAQKTKEQTLAILPLLLAAIVPVYFNFWHYPTLPYYQRFINFAVGNNTKKEYFDKFDANVNRNYDIAQFIVSSTKPNDHIFVWYDSAPIYALSRRLPPYKYVAGYHISDFSSPQEVINMINTQKPELIIILPGSPKIPGLYTVLSQNYLFIQNINGASIYKLINPLVLKAIH